MQLPPPRPLRRPAGEGKVKGQRGIQLALDVEFLDDRKHLPVVELKLAA